MIELSRTVRLCLNDDARRPEPPRHNAFSAWPPIRGLGRYYELHVTCEGEPDPTTGYLVNIKHIDRAVHDHVLPLLRDAVAQRADVAMGSLMRRMFDALAAAMTQQVTALRLNLTPMVYLEAHAMPAQTQTDADSVILAQQYEFSAAHRLHVPAMSDDENRAFFGKCNNPAGHGHNYRVEVAVRCPVDPRGKLPGVEDLDDLVNDAVIDKLDHKHLNLDVPEFATLNPSVENIAKVIHAWLTWRVGEMGVLPGATLPGVALEHVKVWETGKTVCTYRG